MQKLVAVVKSYTAAIYKHEVVEENSFLLTGYLLCCIKIKKQDHPCSYCDIELCLASAVPALQDYDVVHSPLTPPSLFPLLSNLHIQTAHTKI